MASFDSISAQPQCLTVLTVSEQKAFGKEWDSDTRLSGLPTVRSVVIQTVKTIYELDEIGTLRHVDDILRPGHWQYYRGGEELVRGDPFPAHALISVDSVETADEVADYLNKIFEQDRARYPRKNGWQAIAAHSRSGLALDRNHPFFRYKECQVLDSRCARFLVVRKMAVEGMNNKYLRVWGAAELCTSLRKVVQRIGRTLRSAALRHGGQIIVPPASHDRVYIITHEMFESAPDARGVVTSTANTIRDAIHFIVDMHHATADIMTLDEYVEMDVGEQELRDDTPAAQLTRWIKYQILVQIGQAMQHGRRPQIARIVRQFGGTSELRRHSVRAFAQSALDHRPVSMDQVRNGVRGEAQIDAIQELKTKILRIDPPSKMDVLEAERMTPKLLNMESARAWLEQYTWSNDMLSLLSGDQEDRWLRAVIGMHGTVDGRFNQTTFDVRQTPAARVQFMATDLIRRLELEGAGATRIAQLVWQGSLLYLPFEGALPGDFDEGGKYCVPEISFALRNEQFVKQLQAWVCFTLLTEHFLDDLWAVLRFEEFWNNQAGNHREE